MMIKLAAGNQQQDIKSINTKMPACGNPLSRPRSSAFSVGHV